MGLYRVSAVVTYEIDAVDAVQAEISFMEDVENAVSVEGLTSTEVPYSIPPGAERYAENLKELRYGENLPGRKYGVYDDSWWFTNGHTAIRCDSPAPEVKDTEWTIIPSPGFENTILDPAPATVAVWEEPYQPDDGGQLVRSPMGSKVAIQEAYYQLVEEGYPGATWMFSTEQQPLHAMAEGRLVAVVMPIIVRGRREKPDYSVLAAKCCGVENV